MATAKKLPSGSWRVQAYAGKDANGKRIIKSFTAPSKKKAEFMASQYVLNKPAPSAEDFILFGEAMDKYIAGRESVLSPSTIREYKRMRKNNFDSLEKLSLDEITQEVIQDFINTCCSDGDSPKYVRNMHGLISATLNQFKPDMKLRTTLPAKKKPEFHIPSDDEVVKVIRYIRNIKNQDLLVAILLAAYGPMRRSEVCALMYEDIDGNIIHVHRAMVDAGSGIWIIKDKPKTAAGDRYIEYPNFVMKELGTGTGRVMSFNPPYITNTFIKILKQVDVPHFRYHDLRHYSASIQHALGIPDAYIMQRGGWESDATLKQVYRHAMDKETQKANQKINRYFSKIQK